MIRFTRKVWVRFTRFKRKVWIRKGKSLGAGPKKESAEVRPKYDNKMVWPEHSRSLRSQQVRLSNIPTEHRKS